MHFHRLKRREFITLVGGAAATWSLAARAQQPGKLSIIGMLGSAPAAFSPWLPALLQRLRELGWIENRTMAIEYRWTEGHNERYAQFAAELARLKVNVIVALGTPAIVAAKQATAVIPIVFPIASDPVGDGLVASLARPGGNITGLSNEQPDLVGKRLEILRELVPGFSRLGYIANANTPPYVRVRIRRFKKFGALTRFDQGGETERFEVGIGKPDGKGFAPGDVPWTTAAVGRIGQLPKDF